LQWTFVIHGIYTALSQSFHGKYHNKKREVHVILVVPTKTIESIIEVTTQLTKPMKVPLQYPCIICSNMEHRLRNCPCKKEVQNIFCTKIANTTQVTIKPIKIDNVPVNVVANVTTYSQVLGKHVFKE
jgi:hypothetical protein